MTRALASRNVETNLRTDSAVVQLFTIHKLKQSPEKSPEHPKNLLRGSRIKKDGSQRTNSTWQVDTHMVLPQTKCLKSYNFIVQFYVFECCYPSCRWRCALLDVAGAKR